MAVVVITPNPAVDITYRVAEQRIGVTQRVTEIRRVPGGKGINVVRVLRAAGVDAVSLAPLGGWTGSWVDAALRELGVPSLSIPISSATRTTVTVVDGIQHPTMFGEPGPSTLPEEWERLTEAVADTVSRASALVISGSLPPGMDPGLVGRWVSLARAARVTTVVDTSGAALLAAADAEAAFLKPNREEVLGATGTTEEREAAEVLLARGAGTVVVSRGAEGITAHDSDGTVFVPAVAGVVGNPTGAGDAATAGLVAGLLRGEPFTDVLARAAAFGAAAVLRPVAGEVDLDAAARFIHQTRLQEPTR